MRFRRGTYDDDLAAREITRKMNADSSTEGVVGDAQQWAGFDFEAVNLGDEKIEGDVLGRIGGAPER